jgi:hypothetical protein
MLILVFTCVPVELLDVLFITTKQTTNMRPEIDLDQADFMYDQRKEDEAIRLMEIERKKNSPRTKCYCGAPIYFDNPDAAEFSLCKEHAMDC